MEKHRLDYCYLPGCSTLPNRKRFHQTKEILAKRKQNKTMREREKESQYNRALVWRDPIVSRRLEAAADNKD